MRRVSHALLLQVSVPYILMAFAATEHELFSIIANECYALAWILGSGTEVAVRNISSGLNVMRLTQSQVWYTDQVSTLISVTFA